MALFTNVNRMTGFSGAMDINDTVRQIMFANSQRLHTMQRNAMFLQFRQQAYRGVASSLSTFRDRFLGVDVGPNSESIRMQGVLNGRLANIITGSIPGLSVSAGPNATNGTLNFSVIARAGSHQFTSNPQSVGITSSNPLNPTNLRDGDRFTINLNTGGSAEVVVNKTAPGVGTLTITDPGGTVTTQAFADVGIPATNFTNALNNLLGTAFGNLSPVQVPAGAQRVTATLDGSNRLVIDTAGAGNAATITEGSPLPGLRTPNFNNNLDSFLAGWLSGTAATFNVTVGGTNTTISVPQPANAATLSGQSIEQQRAAFVSAFNSAAITAGRPDVGITLGTGADVGFFSFVFANSHEDINIVSSTPAFAGVPVTAERNLTLQALGGFTNGDQNTFNVNNTIGDIFGPGFFTSGPIVGGANAGAFYRDIEINGTTIQLRENMTVAQMNAAITGSNAGVTMAFNSITNTFTLTSNQVGANGQIAGDAAFTDFLTASGLNFSNVVASNSYVSINGSPAIAVSGNTFTYNGVTFNFANVLNPDPNEVIQVEITQDTARAEEVIRSFINEYNALVRELATLRNTSRPVSATGGPFQPLLEHERRAMTESEIRMWEEQARIGTLHRSREIQAILADMRQIITGNVPGPGGVNTNIFSFGITTNVDGTLRIEDPTQFNNILQNADPQDISRTFGTIGDRLNDSFIGFVGIDGNGGRLRDVAGIENGGVLNRNTNIERRITEYNARIDRMTQQLIRRETALFARFNRMEQVIIQSNAQMDFLFSMMNQM